MPYDEDKKRGKRPKRKEAVDFHINETTLTETNKPADFSFHGLMDLKPIGCENARSTRLGEPPEKHAISRKFLTKGLWLNNNKLTHLNGLNAFVANIIDKPELLTLLDLSFNRFKEIDKTLTTFKNLTVLYFHGNLIESAYELVKLKNLPKLRNVTFHGNPVSRSPYYRKIILLCMPSIVHLDHCGVLKSERMQPVHPNALEMLRNYERGDKNDDFHMEPKDTKHKHIDEVTVPKERKDVITKEVENDKHHLVLQNIDVTPGITSEFIKKRRGKCKCCKH